MLTSFAVLCVPTILIEVTGCFGNTIVCHDLKKKQFVTVQSARLEIMVKRRMLCYAYAY